MKNKHRARIVFVGVLVLFLAATTGAQFKKLRKPKIKIPKLSTIFKQKPAITTSLNDALLEIPFLDDYIPPVPLPMGSIETNDEDMFMLFPGAYFFNAQSYCLHAGTYSPSKGDGYIYAPLKGENADIVRSILHNSVKHPEIPQRKIQLLIWAIIARTKIENLSGELRSIASKLLSPEHLKQLKKNELDFIQDMAKEKMYRQLSPVLRGVYKAENEIRRLMTKPGSTYEQIENAAVLSGIPPRDKNDRDIPRGRWSYHPDGYFVRFIPTSYSHTRIEVYVPEVFMLTQDRLGRITTIVDPLKNRIELEYNENRPSSIHGDSSVNAYSFKLVRFVEAGSPRESKDNRDNVCERTGWTFVGVPQNNGKVNSSSPLVDFAKRYGDAKKRKAQFTSLLKQTRKAKRMKKNISDAGLLELMNLAHLKDALLGVTADTSNEKDFRESHISEIITNAWQLIFQLEASGQNVQDVFSLNTAAALESGIDVLSLDPPFDPSAIVAVPGETAKQRLGQSARCRGGGSSQTFQHLEEPIGRALGANGYQVGPDSVYVYESRGGLGCFMVRLGRNGHPLPTAECLKQKIKEGKVPEGSLESPRTLMFGSIQHAGNQTRVTVREVDLETGVILRAGKGDTQGTDEGAVQHAAETAVGKMTGNRI